MKIKPINSDLPVIIVLSLATRPRAIVQKKGTEFVEQFDMSVND